VDKKSQPERKSSRESAELVKTEMVIQSENYEVWVSHEPDGETVYHVELEAVTLHFFNEEWHEFVALIKNASDEIGGGQTPKKK
jgi:hypothetical protein